MKKTLLLISLFAGLGFAALAQTPACTPDTTHFTGSTHVYPDSLPCIVTGQAFSGVVSIQIPVSIDAHDFFSAVPAGTIIGYIDSVEFTGVTGMPAGITSTSVPALGTTWLKPGQYACAIFSGTVNAATTSSGNYALTITGNGCGHATIPVIGYEDSCLNNFNLSRVFPYSLNVCYPTGINEVLDGVSLDIYPNPNQGAFTVTISAADHTGGEMIVIDQLGRSIYSQSIDVTGTKQIPLALGHVAPGIYMLVIHTLSGKSVKQFIIK